MSQETFNRLVTSVLLGYFMVLYAISFATGKPLDTTELLSFLVPMLTHTMHVLSKTQVTTTELKTTGTTGSTNGNGHSTTGAL